MDLAFNNIELDYDKCEFLKYGFDFQLFELVCIDFTFVEIHLY
jgi:hypothetical protein